MHPYAQLRPGRGFEAGRAALYYSQRLAPQPTVRNAVAQTVGRLINHFHTRDVLPIPCPKALHIVGELEREGVARLPQLSSREEIDDLVKTLERYPVSSSGGEYVDLDSASRQSSMATYPLGTILSIPAIRSFANAPFILGVVRQYLGCLPTISSIGVRWSFPKPAQPDSTQMFHRDVDDWRFLKVFMYLTDVDRESGPHRYVRGTHRKAARLRARPYATDELERDYGEDGIETVIGPRGTTFMADTFGIHCGIPPLIKPRLILQVQYSVLPVYAFRYTPLSLPLMPGEDPYVNRLLLQ